MSRNYRRRPPDVRDRAEDDVAIPGRSSGEYWETTSRGDRRAGRAGTGVPRFACPIKMTRSLPVACGLRTVV
jgi:hypothetical protein